MWSYTHFDTTHNVHKVYRFITFTSKWMDLEMCGGNLVLLTWEQCCWCQEHMTFLCCSILDAWVGWILEVVSEEKAAHHRNCVTITAFTRKQHGKSAVFRNPQANRRLEKSRPKPCSSLFDFHESSVRYHYPLVIVPLTGNLETDDVSWGWGNIILPI